MAPEGAPQPLDDILDTVIVGDSRDILRTLPDACVDAVVTDPPAGISFMNMPFDGHRGGRDQWVAWLAGIFAECLRVLKPGGYALVWALPRTSHWTGMALDEAGFELRDQISHLFGTGFPKSQSCLKPAHEVWWLAKAPGPLQPLQIDACRVPSGGTSPDGDGRDGDASAERRYTHRGGTNFAPLPGPRGGARAGRWPPNAVLSHVGGPDGCRPSGVRRVRGTNTPDPNGRSRRRQSGWRLPAGRINHFADADGYEQVESWHCVPQCPVRLLDEQAGPRRSGKAAPGGHKRNPPPGEGIYGGGKGLWTEAGAAGHLYGDTGRASRFFPTFAPEPEDAVPFRYEPKASRRERDAGLSADQRLLRMRADLTADQRAYVCEELRKAGVVL